MADALNTLITATAALAAAHPTPAFLGASVGLITAGLVLSRGRRAP